VPVQCRQATPIGNRNNMPGLAATIKYFAVAFHVWDVDNYLKIVSWLDMRSRWFENQNVF
jgi:hypothetical protein